MKELKKSEIQENKIQTDISRKEAIKKLGMTALSVTTMMILLSEPAKAQDSGDSPDNPPDWP